MMNNDLRINTGEREMGLAWMRAALSSMLEACPLSYQQTKKTARLVQMVPDWLMASWAESLNIDYMGGCTKYRDLAEKAKTDIGRDIAERYVDAHDVVRAGYCLDRLVRSVVKRARGAGCR